MMTNLNVVLRITGNTNLIKLIRASLLGLPLILMTLIAFTNHYEYLSCLIEHQSRENTVDYCTYFDGRWEDYEYLP